MPSETTDSPPDLVRVSLGSAIVLGLLDGKLDAVPTAAYLMTFRKGKCVANCGFCPQARESSSRADLLSRISWPEFETKEVLQRLHDTARAKAIRRVCIQALNYPKVLSHVQILVKAIRKQTDVPISVSCQPLTKNNLKLLAEAGVERIGIPLDAVTEELFRVVKGKDARGPYEYANQLRILSEATQIFGHGKVSTHLIANLGESEEEMLRMIQKCADMGVLPALFSFTPISGTALESRKPPSVESYRRLQLARHLILEKTVRFADMRFNEKGKLVDTGADRRTLVEVLKSRAPFLTSGCPNCNRPYYNEKPSGPIYNYPRNPTEEELAEIRKQLLL